MRKTRFLSTAAAALLLTAGGALAQGMSKDTPERAPAAQQGAPAEKVAPSMKEGQKASPGEKAQMTPDAKSGKARETTGQAPKSDEKTGQTMEKSGPAGSSKSEMDRSKSEQNAQSPKGTQSPSGASSTSQSEQNRSTTTTGQGAAGGSAKLTAEQRTKITGIIHQHKVEPTRLNVAVSVGTRIPASVHLYPLPVEVITIYPEWRGYEYILVGNEIVVINPRTHEIVAVLEA